MQRGEQGRQALRLVAGGNHDTHGDPVRRGDRTDSREGAKSGEPPATGHEAESDEADADHWRNNSVPTVAALRQVGTWARPPNTS